MIKRLLFSAMAAGSMAFSANAAEVTLWQGECNLGTSWSESFAIPAADLSVLPADNAVLKLTYTLDASCQYWQYKPVADTEGWPALEVASELGNSYSCISVDAGSTTTNLPLGAADIATIKAGGLRFQGYGMIFSKVSVDTEAEVNENLLWEGEYTITGWNSGAEFASSKVSAGDILCYTFTEAGNSGAQVLLKNSSWANLLGTSKITSADMAKGSVYVGVTQDMLDNCGGKIFVQGDGGAVLTKVEKTGETFDAEGVLAYGARVPGVQVFAPIPDDAKAIAVEFDANPEWAQFCNSSWTDLELANTKNEADGKATITYTLTADVIAAINATENSEFIINGGGANVTKVYVVDPSQVGISDITADDNAPVDFFNLQGMRISEPAAGQVVIRRQGDKVQKMLVK
ncbi:MAG: hypothetical protein K2F97_01850 [Muribaculaceae bacterium]|nr:hypothetical protein [Muribaculaceae bacterium]